LQPDAPVEFTTKARFFVVGTDNRAHAYKQVELM